jgi:atypical dual specificity phosphatase
MAINVYGVNQVTEIYPNLYLTSIYGATKENITRRSVSLLINAAQELPKTELNGVESIKLFLDDTPHALASVYFDRISDKINDHVSNGGCALLHCVLGVSRSTTLCLAYLMKYQNMSLKNAFDYVATRRPCARPNPGFWRQLLDYEKRLTNLRSKNNFNSQVLSANMNSAGPANALSAPNLNINPSLFGKEANKLLSPITGNTPGTGTVTIIPNVPFDEKFFNNHMTPTSKLYNKNMNRLSISRNHPGSFKSSLSNKNENSILSALTITPSFQTNTNQISNNQSGCRGAFLINNNSQDIFLQQKPASTLSTTYRSSYNVPKY